MSGTFTLPEEWQTLSCPKLPDIKVWVTMGDKVLTSLKKDTIDQANVAAEIAGIEGREFQVHFYDGRQKLAQGFQVNVLLDGKDVASDWKRKADDDDEGCYSEPLNSKRRLDTFATTSAGKNHVRPFVFGKIATSSDANSDRAKRALSEVGTIKIIYRKVKNARHVRVPRKSANNGPDPEDDERDYMARTNVEPIDEKAKKAQFGLSAGLGEVRAVERQKTRSSSTSGWTYQWKGELVRETFLTWTFRIRSPIGLQDDILPDEPEPSTSKRSLTPDDDDLSDLDEEEIDRRLAACDERKAKLERRKRAKTEQRDRKPKVTPPPPYDWQGSPPIEMETRTYVDFSIEEAEKEEQRLIKRKALETEEQKQRKTETIEL